MLIVINTSTQYFYDNIANEKAIDDLHIWWFEKEIELYNRMHEIQKH